MDLTSNVLDAHVIVQFASAKVDVAIAGGRGEVIGVLGPNGAGKTTVLRALAGLQPIDDGRIAFGSLVLDDPATGTFVSPADRNVGVVFQDYRLFPHLTAAENVAFGLRTRGADRRDALKRAKEWLDRVGLSAQQDDRPSRLSGGQAQRVALARALATAPDLLLLDEPLAAIDAESRAQMRDDLRRHLTAFGGVAVLVSHDPADLAVLADRTIRVERGRGGVPTTGEEPR
jgi:molybdate transport system ATP-binding protein